MRDLNALGVRDAINILIFFIGYPCSLWMACILSYKSRAFRECLCLHSQYLSSSTLLDLIQDWMLDGAQLGYDGKEVWTQNWNRANPPTMMVHFESQV